MDTSMDIPNRIEVIQNNLGEDSNSGRQTFSTSKHQFGNEDLFLSLKCHIDSQQKLIQLYRTRIRSFEMFRKYCQRLVHLDDGGDETINFNLKQFQNEYNKFDLNYRYFRKRIRNLKKQTKPTLSIRNQNVYDILYDLAAKLESNDNFETRYFCDNQIYPEVSINEVIESTESANDSTVNNASTQDNNNYYNNYNLNTIQIYPKISLNIVKDQQPESISNDSINLNDPVNNDGDSEDTLDNSEDYDSKDYYFVEPHKHQTAKVKSKKLSKSTKTAAAAKKAPRIKRTSVKQEISTDSDSVTLVKAKRPPNPVKTPKVYRCEVEGCQYSTIKSWNLNQHKGKHSDVRPFKCDKCDMAFTTKTYLKAHQNTHEGQRFGCTFEGCTVNYSTKHDLSRHIKRFHTKEAPLIHCDWEGCDYTTYGTTYGGPCLKIHQAVHTGERPFKCLDCEMAFKSQGNLWRHRQTHQTERRFKCDFEGCDYASCKRELFQKHQYVHNVDRPFRCVWPACEMSFKWQSGLWKHKAMHENQRRYKCNWEGCQYAANLSGDLRLHIQTVHEKKKILRNNKRRRKRPAPTDSKI